MGTCAERERTFTGLSAIHRHLDVEGVVTSVWETGDGPPLLLLHGGIESGGVMWAPAARRLAERYRVVVPDLPGLGESAPVDCLDVDTFGGWLTGVMQQTRLDRPTLVAHSLVGGLTARFAAHHSEAIGRLILYSAPAIGRYRPPMRLRYVAARFAIRPSAANADRFDRFALYDLDATRRRDSAWYAAFDAYTRRQAAVPHVKKTMNRLFTEGTKQILDTDLAGIATPTTLLWGRHDRIVPLSLARAAAAQHGWPLHVIDRAAHAPHIEQPDAFVAELESMTPVPDSGDVEGRR
jgi:pimeloyl-ACP methyl ester carboxylesterase